MNRLLSSLSSRFSRKRVPVQQIGAGVAVLRDGRLLLVRRADNGLWDIPGGRVEPGERVEDAARRELHEETSLSGGTLTLLGVFSGPQHRHLYPDGNVVEWVTVLFVTREVQGVAKAADDAAEVRWWPLNDLPVDVSPATRAYFAALRSVAA